MEGGILSSVATFLVCIAVVLLIVGAFALLRRAFIVVPGGEPDTQIGKLKATVSENIGFFAVWWHELRARWRVRHIANVNAEITALIEHEELLPRLERAQQTEVATFRVTMAGLVNKEGFINIANREERTPALQEAFQRDVDAAAVEVKKLEGQKRVEREDDFQRTLNEIRAAVEHTNSDISQLDNWLSRLTELNRKIKRLPEKQRRPYEQQVEFLEEMITLEQNRLLQARNGNNQRGTKANASDAGGFAEEDRGDFEDEEAIDLTGDGGGAGLA